MKIIIFIIILLLIGAFFIISENNLTLKNAEDREKFLSLYTNWVGRLFENSKNLIGYVIKLDWLPDNES